MIHAFITGIREFRRSFTSNFDDSGHGAAYEWGREWAHRLTLRRFES